MNPDLSELAVARFAVPVEGFDPWDGVVHLSTRHRVAAVHVRRDGEETVFVNDDGEIVARWASRLIEDITWPDAAQAVSPEARTVGSRLWRQEVQEQHPRAYQRWSPEEEAQLRGEYHSGLTVADMAERHQRRPGGITSRLVRFGLIDPDPPEIEIGTSPAGAAEARVEPRPAEPPPVPPAPPAPPPPPPRPAVTIVERDDDCRHGLTPVSCSICLKDGRGPVYTTAGGLRFHADPACPALLEGQRHVDTRGGLTAPIEKVHRGSARLEGRDPCRVCRPD